MTLATKTMIQYYNGNYRAVADIFYAAVHKTAISFYSKEQVDACAPDPIDYDFWQSRCELKRPFLSLEQERIVGFLELDPDGHIDCHYVHPAYNRKGYGEALLLHAITIALAAE